MRYLIFAIIALSGLATSAQLTASKAFTSAPSDVFPLLDTNTRMDMVDYYNSGLATPSANRMDGRSSVTDLSPASLTVKISESSSAQVAILAAGSDTVIAVVSTVAAPGLDSTLKFYDREWKPLQASRYFTAPAWKEWVTQGHDAAEVTAYAPFMLASYYIDPAKGTLTVTNNLSTFLDEDVYEMVAPALHPSLVYRWNGKRFTL